MTKPYLLAIFLPIVVIILLLPLLFSTWNYGYEAGYHQKAQEVKDFWERHPSWLGEEPFSINH